MARSDKLYKDSPTTERDSDGKVGVKKPSEATAESTGVTEPVPTEQVGAMHERHEMEMKDMHKRHLKEMKKMYVGKGDGEGEKDMPEPAKKIEKKD